MGKMNVMSGKKGLFFTLIAITTVVLFLVIFTPDTELPLRSDKRRERARIATIDNYVNDLQNRYMENVLRSASHKALISMIYYVNSTGLSINDVESAFSEIATQGAINGIPIDGITGKKIMEGNTLSSWRQKIISVGRGGLDVNTSINISGLTLFQTDPWNVKSTMQFNITVKSSLAEWHRYNLTATAEIGIAGLYDPYYLLNSGGIFDNRIKRSSVEFNQWDVEKVREHLKNGTYVHWQDSEAPSFLMRFTNTLTNSPCCGIESLVNPKRISPQEQTESYVEYLFWTHTVNDCKRLYRIIPFSSDFPAFKIDLDHIIKYNIKETQAEPVC